MRTYTHKGWYGYDTSYVLEKLEDWDEYEKILGKENIKLYNPNFYSFKEDFIKYIGKIWVDKDNVHYKIIALEDDNAACDWYWVVQNVDDERDIKYELANDNDFYKKME